MARPDKAKNGTPRRSSPRTTARRSSRTRLQAAASSSKGTAGPVAPEPSGASSSTSRPDATTDEVLIVDETQELLDKGITGYAVIGYRQAPRKD